MIPSMSMAVHRARVGFVAGALTLGTVLATAPPSALSETAWHTAAVGLLMAIWWISEAIPIPATALLPLMLFPVLGIVPIDAAAAPYANPVIFLFLGGFLLAAALQRCGLHRRMALVIISIVGSGPRRLVAGFMVATAFISMWVSNTATVVMLLPTALSVLELIERAAEHDAATRRNLGIALLLSLAYAANIGGVGTLIGTPPNALLAGFLDEAYGIRIGFVRWMTIGVPLVLVALPVTWLLLTRVLHPLPVRAGGAAAEFIRAEVRALGPMSRSEMLVGGITLLTATAWLTRPLLERTVTGLSDAGIAIMGALLLFTVSLTQRGGALLTWDDAERLPWGVLILFGGGLSLASAIETTGLARWVGESLAGVGPWPLLGVIVLMTSVIVFLTELTSNTATAAAFLPVAASLSVGLGAPPSLLAIPVALGASCAFMMPVATPPNAIVYGSGRLTIPQMARAGVALNVVMIALITLAATWLVPRAMR